MMNFLVSNKNHVILLLLISYGTHYHAFAQIQHVEQHDAIQKVMYGGSLGASFSNGYFSGYLAPKVIYNFNQFVAAGVGASGTYSSSSRYSAITTGGSLIGLLHPFSSIQFSGEFEQNYVSRNLKTPNEELHETYWYPALFMGLGYTIGKVTVGLRYDILYDDEQSIHNSALLPFVSFYF